MKEIINCYFTEHGFNFDNNVYNDDTLNKLLDSLQKAPYNTLYNLSFQAEKNYFSDSFKYLNQISYKVIETLYNQFDIELTRENTEIEYDLSLLNNIPFAIGQDYINEQWLINQYNHILDIFKKEIKEYDGTVKKYFLEKNNHINTVGRVFFHLIEYKDDNHYPFAFMATYSSKQNNKTKHIPLKQALKEFENNTTSLLELLTCVTKVSNQSKFIKGLLDNGELFYPIKLTMEEAYTFLKESDMYKQAGIMCRIPNWWRRKNKMSTSIKVDLIAKIGVDDLFDFNPSICINDQQLTNKELKELLNQNNGLMLFKGQYIEIDHDKLNEVLNLMNNLKDEYQEGINIFESLRLEANLNNKYKEIEIKNGTYVNSLKHQLTSINTEKQLPVSNDVKATLRPYQITGYSWLNMMANYHFGACLADDMGLGKTLQVISFLAYHKNDYKKNLLIIPASLIGNWKKELEKFIPNYQFKIIHTSNSNTNETFHQDTLYITTYALAAKLEAIANTNFDAIILDEAQAIKNAGTKQSKIIRQLNGRFKIALTGTPIENNLMDLWSIFDFINKGLLGSQTEFKNYIKNINENDGYSHLRNIISPFIMRRLKTDKSIISDLPEKIEIDEYINLSSSQNTLYKKLLNELKQSLQTSEGGIAKKGLVLSSIMKFKQICNHPSLYLQNNDYKEKQSGKFEKLKDLCKDIYDAREQVIIFTQFKEMCEPLNEYLKEIFNQEGMIIHGGTSIKKRQAIVDKFNEESYSPYLILSLKAGGVGLNLTSANHVIHFDRWWNPAIENQATDRAYRIGQTKNVIVHKFVCSGTIEEKINNILNSKQKMVDQLVVSSGEKWLSDLSDDKLIEMISLEEQ